jgi:hypothetical protein
MIPGLSLPVETLFPGWCAMWAPRGPGEWVMTYRPFAAQMPWLPLANVSVARASPTRLAPIHL